MLSHVWGAAVRSIPFDTTQVFIGGRWQGAVGGLTLPLLDPSSGALLAEIARGGADDVDAAVAAAQAALDGPWGALTAAERGRVLLKMSALVLAQADELARLEALDVGKPLKQGRADAVALARYLEFYGGAADKVHGETIPFANGYTAFTLREPHGVTAHIVPWNYPMQIIGRSVGAALAMGNACVLKPAEEACLTALAFARIAAGRRHPCGGVERRAGPGRRSRCRAGVTPRRPPHLVHRFGGRGRADPGRGGEQRGAGDAGTRRQEPATRLCRRRPRRRAALPRQCRHPERRSDLLGGVAHPGAAAGVRDRRAAHGRALPRAARGPGARRPRRGAGDLAPAAAASSKATWRSCATAACPSPRRRRLPAGLPAGGC